MPDQLFELNSQPGVRRDGTTLDSPFYNDGVWVRWQRQRPMKMGGYRAMSTLANGPIRSIMVDSRNGINSVHSFSQWGIQRLQFSPSGAGGNLDDRTPSNFLPDNRLTWTHAAMTSSTGGSYTALLAASSPDLLMMDSDEAGYVYTGGIANSLVMTLVNDQSGPLRVSGGITVLQPFAVVFGSNGLIRNSKENDFSPSGWDYTATGTLANEANVAGTKFIAGAPVRGGSQAPAGLFWAIDALVRMSFVGGTTMWQYDTLSQPTSILSKKGIVEHDGKFFWPGTDRFLFYNGVVQELPNQMNSNWFFENINFNNRNKVWGTKIPRWGEIWWFYPRGDAVECDHAVIFNYLENTWYDAKKERSAGGHVQLFPYPIWGGREDRFDSTVLTIGFIRLTSAQTAAGNATLTFAATTGVVDGMMVLGEGIAPGTKVSTHTATAVVLSAAATAIVAVGTPITFSSMTVPFLRGDIVTGTTSHATGTVVRADYIHLNVDHITGQFNTDPNAAGAAIPSEPLTGPRSAVATSMQTPYLQEVDTIYQHENGKNKVIGQQIAAIEASFTSKDFGFAVGQPFAETPVTADVTTRVVRVEPDFDQVGDLLMTTQGRSFPQDPIEDTVQTVLKPDSKFEDIRNAQARILRVKISTNSRSGDFSQGKVMLTLQPGDERSQEIT
jgi:hypothetical protein